MNYINGETVSIILFFIGLYGLIARRNIVKSIVSVSIMQVACIIFFLSINFNESLVAPIGDLENKIPADPFPQALMITAIIIGVSVTAVSLTMFITLYHKYGSTNFEKVKRKRLKNDDN